MISVAESYLYAERLTRAEAKNFIYTFRLLPPERRRGIFAVYAFSRRADDAVDAAEDGSVTADKARADLAHLRALLGEPLPDDPLAPALRDTRERFSIPREPFEELLLGMEMDLVKTRYATFEELSLYCYRAASAIGLIAIEVFGHQGPAAREPAIQLGIAMQLTNILRDVLEDRARGRIYLPAEDMQRFGYSEEDLLRGLINDSFRALMRFEVERARSYFRAAEPLFALVHPESRFCPILLQRLYSRILDRIEAQDYDVIGRRPRLPWHEKIRIAGATWLEARRCRAAGAGAPLTSRKR